MTANHVHDDLVIFQPDQAKGETDARVIFLIPEVKSLLDRQIAQYPTGELFRNSRGRAWTKDAVICRMSRISEKVGFRRTTVQRPATECLIDGGMLAR